MVMATDELIRKATTTTTTVSSLIPKIWAAQLERNLRRRAVFEQSALVNTDLLAPDAGDTVYIPILPDLGAAVTLAEGTDMVPIALNTATSVALVPTEVGVTVEITRKALDRMKYDGMSAVLDRLAYAMSLKMEGDFAALYNAVVPGTANKMTVLYPNGHASGTIVAGDVFSDALMLSGIAYLQQQNNVPFEDGQWRLYISPTQFTALLNDANTRQDLRWAAPERLISGEVGELHGCRIFVTNYIPGATGNTAITENTISVSKAILLAPRAFALAYKRKPEVIVDPTLYDMGRRRRFGVVADYDIELLHNERGVVLTSAGA
jgi:N4-gp56 family major capsid protein